MFLQRNEENETQSSIDMSTMHQGQIPAENGGDGGSSALANEGMIYARAQLNR